uniref:Uncharacterized protein n=1 Tax=viral metagenome TaxID=1070528 RepID=A0A6C0BGV2_9ZZZZ
MTFWRFCRTDVSILRIVLLAWSNQFARLFNRSRNTTKMGNACGVVHAIEYLRYTNLVGSTDFAAAKVARRQGGFEADIHNGRFDDFVDIVNIDDIGPISCRFP